MKKILLSLVVSGIFLASSAYAQLAPKLELFHGRDCPHCHQELEWLPELETMYPGLVVDAREVWYDAANQQAFNERMQELGQEASAVPTNIINGDVVVGFDKDSILNLMLKHYGAPVAKAATPDPVVKVDESVKQKSWFERMLVWMFGKKDTAAQESNQQASTSSVQVGQEVPDFTVDVLLKDDTNRPWSLSEARGKWTLLFFYPKDRTFVCPTEIREMVAAKPEFERLGVEVVLASADTLESHAEWRPDVGGEDLTYKWMADTDNAVSKLLGIYDAAENVPLRGTFLIDPEGVLQFEMTTNTLVGRNIDEIVRIAEANQTGELCPASWKPGDETLGEEK